MPAEQAFTTEELAVIARPAVVNVRSSDGSGTGWVYRIDASGNAWILTNEHVVDNDATVRIYPANGGGPYLADVIGTDELRDLAVVRFCCDSGLRAFELASRNEVRQGSEVLAFGYPYRAGVLSDLSVSDGIISSVGYYGRRDSYTVQTTAESNPGNSGGPLVNMFGKVVGTIRASVDFSPSGSPIDGIAFAVAARTIRDRLPALESGAGRAPTATPTPTPTPIPPPSCIRSSDPSVDASRSLVLVAVGNTDQRTLDAVERRCVAEALSTPINEIPAVETGYKLADGFNPGDDEVVVNSSGDLILIFAEIPGSSGGFKPLIAEGQVKFFGRVCRGGKNCDEAHFQDLSGSYINLDEDLVAGSRDISPQIRTTAQVPADVYLRIEMIGYYTPDATAPVSTPTSTPTSGSSSQPGPFSAVIYDGWVTANNDPSDLEGMTLSAKIGDWVSESVTVGQDTPDLNGFKNLTVNPPPELLGSQVIFLLSGTVESTTTDYYAIINDDGSECTTCPINFPEFRREFTIDFPNLPSVRP